MAMGCYDLFAEHGEMLPKDINDIMLRYDATDEQIKRSLRREQYQEEKQFTEFSINRLGAMASRIIWDEK